MNPRAAEHGGAFWDALGSSFEHLDRTSEIIAADVLDAWFPPSPKVVAAIRDRLDWAIATSPPTHAEGVVASIGRARSIPCENVVVGPGSSSLLFLALPQWLGTDSKALILDPTYGEYAHLFENVIGCEVVHFALSRETGFSCDPGELSDVATREQVDCLALVNPNSPTGTFFPQDQLVVLARRLPASTILWIDETYIDYVGSKHSLEPLTSEIPNLVVCKSMSKVYALSGLRVGYLCTHAERARELRRSTPPWPLSLPAQIGAVEALGDTAYYEDRWRETVSLRGMLANGLRHIGLGQVFESGANFVLLALDSRLGSPARFCAKAAEKGLYLRDLGSTGRTPHGQMIRIAVKNEPIIRRMLGILRTLV